MGTIAEALAILAKGDVPVLLIGANALQAFGYTRATMDVDCMIAAESSERLKEMLCANGFQWAGSMSAFHEFWPGGDPLKPPIHAMRVDAATFEKMWSRSIATELSGIPLRVPCMAHLLALKLFAARQNPKRHHKDMRDVGILLELNPGKVGRKDLQQICERYASDRSIMELKQNGYL